jgi:hypothetical protein
MSVVFLCGNQQVISRAIRMTLRTWPDLCAGPSMTGLNASSNVNAVPDWHRVSPVARLEAVRMDTSGADRDPHAQAENAARFSSAAARIARRPQHTAATAASAYAAHVLFEASRDQDDPAVRAHGRAAYGRQGQASQRVLAVA